MGQEHARVFQRFAPTKVLLSLLHHPMLGQCCTVNSGWSGWCFGFFLLVVFHASSTIRSALSQRCSRVQLRVDSEEKANSRSPVGLTHNRWMALVGLSHCGKRTQAQRPISVTAPGGTFILRPSQDSFYSLKPHSLSTGSVSMPILRIQQMLPMLIVNCC